MGIYEGLAVGDLSCHIHFYFTSGFDRSAIWRDDGLSDFSTVAHEFCSRTLVSLQPLVKEGNYLNQSCQGAVWGQTSLGQQLGHQSYLSFISITFFLGFYLRSDMYSALLVSTRVEVCVCTAGKIYMCQSIFHHQRFEFGAEGEGVIKSQQVATQLAITL